MYCSHFNLKKKPFQLSSDNSFLWLSETHAQALDLLKQGINGSQQLLVLSGDIGTGKTTLVHELRDCLAQTTVVAHISDPSIELDYLFFSIAQGLGFDRLLRDDKDFNPVFWAFLNRQSRAKKKSLIIIDEAHLIPEKFLAQLPSWTEFAPDDTLTILLSGQLELHQVMEKALGHSWEELVDIHAVLSPLEEKQTREYIDRRLELAGAAHKIFVPGAVREVHGYTKGIPRRINIACDQAMIAAYSNEMKTVDARIFQEAVGILELPQVPAQVSDLAPASQVPLAAQEFRWPAKKTRPVLAVAVFLAVIACLFYFRNPSNLVKIFNPPILKSAAQQDTAEIAARQEPSQAALQAPLASFDNKDAQSGSSVDMHALVNEAFMKNKSDSKIQAGNHPPQLTAGTVPAVETPSSEAAGPSASNRQDPESVQALNARPDPSAVIDWILERKSQ